MKFLYANILHKKCFLRTLEIVFQGIRRMPPTSFPLAAHPFSTCVINNYSSVGKNILILHTQQFEQSVSQAPQQNAIELVLYFYRPGIFTSNFVKEKQVIISKFSLQGSASSKERLNSPSSISCIGEEGKLLVKGQHRVLEMLILIKGVGNLSFLRTCWRVSEDNSF